MSKIKKLILKLITKLNESSLSDVRWAEILQSKRIGEGFWMNFQIDRSTNTGNIFSSDIFTHNLIDKETFE